MLDNYIPDSPVGDDAMPMVLVTGATGFLGRNLVSMLAAKGYRVRALARQTSNIEPLKKFCIEVFYGDIGDKSTIESAFQGIDVVVHAAADTVGNKESGEVNTVQGTRNVVDLCQQYCVRKLIYMSSCNVYDVAGCKKGYVLNEEARLEKFPAKRGRYSNAKMKADKIVTDAMKYENLPAVCLRPGTYFGQGNNVYSPMIGFSFGTKLFLIIGNGKLVLPLVYIENITDAIITVIEKDEGTGSIYNIVDDEGVNKKQYVNNLLKKLYPKSLFIYLPYGIFYFIVFIQEVVFRLFRMKPVLTRYRVISSQNPVVYDSSKIRKELGWIPPYTLHQAFVKIIEHERCSVNQTTGIQ